MRNNLPITQIEYVMHDGESIVSKTDLSGNITYVNPYFLEASGFDEQELMGAPHNIVRHPDMPPEAYADLWKTVKDGHPWTGIVKNRRKNGDFYWVRANVTPIRENGRVAGYMSVRTKPAREEIEAAQKIYRDFRQGKANGLAISRGEIVRTGWAGIPNKLRRLPLQQQLNWFIGGMLALLIATTLLPQAWSLPLVIASILLSGVFWHHLQNNVIRPLSGATDFVYALMGGDLLYKFNVSGHGEVGQLLRGLSQLNVNLSSIINDVQKNVEAIRVGTAEIASGNMDLSGRTESQAASLEETAASMDQIASTVKRNAANAMQADELAITASRVAAVGGDVMSKVSSTMDKINVSAEHIVDIVALIDGIGNQTNILALNAAVEAARAGEQGRGFAVVASEVRQLAQRSAQAAKEIKKLVDDSVATIKTGTVQVHETGRTMNELVGSVEKVTHIMGEITVASNEQSIGIEQVNKAVSIMDEATQQNAALVEQAASAAANLAHQTVKLSQAMSVFQIKPVPVLHAGRRAAHATRQQTMAKSTSTKRLRA